MTISTQLLVQGSRNLVTKYTVSGAADLTDVVLFDASAYGSSVHYKLMQIWFDLTGFSAHLKWYGDGATTTDLLDLATDHPHHFNFTEFGGIINDALTPTGDIIISTKGLVATEFGTIILFLQNKG